MVPHACADEDLAIVHPSLLVEEGVCGLDDLLRLDLAVGCPDVPKCVVPLPLLALPLPLLAARALRGLDEPLQGLQRVLRVRPDGHGRLHDLPEAVLVDVDVHDATGAVSLRRSGLRRVLVHDTGCSVIEAASNGDDAVRILDREVRVRRTVHSEHVQGQRVPLVEDPHAVNRRSYWDLRLRRHPPEHFGAVPRTLANIEDRPLRSVDDVCRHLDALLVHHRRGIEECEGRSHEDRCRNRRFGGNDVLRQVYVAGARAPRAGNAERLVDRPRQLVELKAGIVPLGAGARYLRCWALLEGISTHCTRWHLPREDNHGHAIS
mmetsp:Transcript_100748/g.280624  ORF Transcript_100748/g.280624 Transcript_100748/m.280624 type:complete len:320 (-) Transcript_100748:447-1406(-)